MYPNQTPEQPQYSIDYLNQIAPQNTKKGIPKNMRLIFAILGAALLIAAVIMVIGSSSKEPNTSELLAARLAETATITKDAQTNLKSSQLRSVNSNLTLYLTNTNRDLAEQLTTAGFNADKLPTNVLASEAASAEELAATLEDARLNALFDRTYSREMAYLLETIQAYMDASYDKTKSTTYKDFLEKAYDDLTPIQKQFAEYNEAN